MPLMTRTPLFSMRMPPPIQEAAEAYAAAQGQPLSRVINVLLCEAMGRKDLLDTLKDAGRPVGTKKKPPPKKAVKTGKKRV